jgi:hypothetical protein
MIGRDRLSEGGSMGTATTRGIPKDSVVEIVGYVGAAVALAAAVIAVGEAAGTGTQLFTELIIAGVLLLAGWTIASNEADVFQRMRSIFWFGSGIAFQALVTLFVTDTLELTGQGGQVLTGVVATAFAAALWVATRRSLQQILMVLFGWATVLAIVLEDGDPTSSFTTFGVVTWLLGLAVLAAGAAGALAPRRTALVLGSVGSVLLGPFFVGFEFSLFGGDSGPSNGGMMLGAGMGALMILAGDRLSERAVAGIGIAGAVVYPIALVATNVHEQGPAIALLVVGLVLLGGAIVAARGGTPEPAAPPAPPPPPPG